MKKGKITVGILLVIFLLSLTACGARGTADAGDVPEGTNPPVSADASEENTVDPSENLGAQAEGHVVEFADDHCVISPAKSSEDGRLSWQAAAGYENPEENITVHYQEGCVVQIADFNVATGEKNLTDAQIADIKKQTSVMVFGEWTDDHNLNATTIYIARYQ